jgi:hypothetical protein
MQTDVLLILTSGGRILSGEEMVLLTGYWIPDSGYRILDTGYWILDSDFLSDINSFAWL